MIPNLILLLQILGVFVITISSKSRIPVWHSIKIVSFYPADFKIRKSFYTATETKHLQLVIVQLVNHQF